MHTSLLNWSKFITFKLKKTNTLLKWLSRKLVEHLSLLFIEAVTQSRLNFNTKTKKITLDNYIIHII